MKWWFSDYDGTLNLNDGNGVTKKDVNFIKKWISKGNAFTIATGRMFDEINPILTENDITYKYIICNNGAVVYEANANIVSEVPIPMDVRKQILDALKENIGKASLAYCLRDTRKIYAPLDSFSKKEVVEHLKNKGVTIEESKSPDEDILNNPTLNTIYIFTDEDKIESLRGMFGVVNGCKMIKTSDRVLELMNEKVSKGYAIEQIQKIHNFFDKDIIASGDGENDIEMLQKAERAFVMRGHQENVEKYAQHIINAIYEIEKYL